MVTNTRALLGWLAVWYCGGLSAWIAVGFAVYYWRVLRIMWYMLHGGRVGVRRGGGR